MSTEFHTEILMKTSDAIAPTDHQSQMTSDSSLLAITIRSQYNVSAYERSNILARRERRGFHHR